MLNNERGDAFLFVLIVCISTIIALSIVTKICLINTSNRINYEKIDLAIEAAKSGLKKTEFMLENNSAYAFSVLSDYLKDDKNKYLLSSNPTSEQKIIVDSINNTHCVVEILELLPNKKSTILKILSKGYNKNYEQKIIGIYELSGVLMNSTPVPQYSLYIASDGYDFNQKIKIDGDVYFGGGFRFNSNASGTVINGNLKTGNSNILSEFNGTLTVNGKVLFQTPVKVQNGNLTVQNKAGFLKSVENLKSITLQSNGYFGADVKNNAINMQSNTVYHTGSCAPNKFINAKAIIENKSMSIPNEINLLPGNDNHLTFNYDNIKNYAVDFSTLGITELTGKNLQYAYEFNKTKLWNGYLVVNITNKKIPQFNKPDGKFKGKVIFIVETNLPVNGKWYESEIGSETIIYVKKGTISQLGWNGNMSGFIYIEPDGEIQYSFNPNSLLSGFICHTDKSGFQANTSNLFTLTYDKELIELYNNLGLITLPKYEINEVFILIDFRIRPILKTTYLL